MKKVLILGNSQLVVYKFRKELIERLVKNNYDVFVSFSNGPFGEGEKVSKEFGCKFIETSINRRGKNPLQDIKLLMDYISIIKKVNPDIVLAYTVKPDIYGGLACRILKKHFVANITGLGSGLVEKGFTQKIMIKLYKEALKYSKCVFFQNEGDKKFFERNKIVLNQGILIPGSGVNVEEFIPLDYPNEEKIKFSYIARVMKSKGIEEYLKAAKIIKDKYSNVEFDIYGYCEEDYKGVLKEAELDGTIKYHGLVDDIKLAQKKTHCTILPTYHPEGISNVLLESAACARPVITTNRVGCKETVIDGVTGYLINEKDYLDLIEKIEMFISLSNKEKKMMGIKGRKKIEKEFNRDIVVNKYMEVIENL